MRTAIQIVALATALVAPALAQKDFLTADEVDQLRVTQEPELRLKLYVKFAQQRMDLLDQLIANQKTGRSGVIHQTLEQLTQIVEAIDVVIDDTLHKRKELLSIEFIAKSEREMLAKLEKYNDATASDYGRYKFALENAIDTLTDSAELAEEDLKARTRDVDQREVDLKKQRETMMTPESVEAAKKAEEKKAEDAAKDKKKPTLLRKGETLGTKK